MPLEPFLIHGVFRDDEVLGSRAFLIFGKREVVVVLGITEVHGIAVVLEITMVIVSFRRG